MGSKKFYEPRQKNCNVLMRDYLGRHRLNNDFDWEATPKQIMEQYDFQFAPGSVQINTVPIDDGMLDVHLKTLLGMPEVLSSYQKTMRLLILGNDLSQFRKPKKPANDDAGREVEKA